MYPLKCACQPTLHFASNPNYRTIEEFDIIILLLNAAIIYCMFMTEDYVISWALLTYINIEAYSRLKGSNSNIQLYCLLETYSNSYEYFYNMESKSTS